ncbi:MAG: tRNA preQ1(34) S-adenosylmethionine ribosyltransferase-isomerase QueA [Fusobacteria bacterium]|nr:tRNA preQ1(34) S-adenosylmethionine ribosyltransferase-isomerase QueA [Fusobacteriota bacterium]
MKLSDYDFHLPDEQIAQTPIEKRDTSKLLVVDRETGEFEERKFYNIIDYLTDNDVLVMNNTKVIPARLLGSKAGTGGQIEVFLIKRHSLNVWECLLKPGKRLKVGQVVEFSDGELLARLIEIKENGNRVMEFAFEGIFEEILNRLGEMPLPPYIKEKLKNHDRYQTVYAKEGESVAAPTAGLHFTPELLSKIKAKGVEILEINLEVGIGTFRPVQVENVLEHDMHGEMYEVTSDVAQKINEAKKKGKRIVAVGTTSVRTLESAAVEMGRIRAEKKETKIFIYPGYEFKVVDALITNFHLPKSTLLMLVSALSSRELMLNAYEFSVENEYRFFSFGDSMFIK